MDATVRSRSPTATGLHEQPYVQARGNREFTDLAVQRGQAVDRADVVLGPVGRDRVRTALRELALDPERLLRAVAHGLHERHAVAARVGDAIDVHDDD